MRSGALAVVVSLAVASSAAAETRTATQWPFRASSPWNSSIGSGAQYLSPLCDAQVRAENTNSLHPRINAEQYSAPVFQASSTDPLLTTYVSADPQTATPHGTAYGPHEFPAAAQEAAGTDRSLAVLEPNGAFDNETWNTYLYPT